MSQQPEAPMGEVIHARFPQVDRAAEQQPVEPFVFDAEMAINQPKRGLLDLLPRRSGVLVRRPTGTLVRRDQVAAAGKRAARVTWKYTQRGARTSTVVATRVAQGHRVAGQRVWHATTLAVYDEQIRLARAAGEMELLAAWIDRKAVARRDRHRRVIELPRKVWGITKVTGLGICGTAVLVEGVIPLYLAVSEKNADAAGAWYHSVASTVRGIAGAVAATWDFGTSWPVVAGGVGAWLLATYAAGRHATVPQWATAPVDGTEGRAILPTADAIIDALRHLGVPALDKAFKAGWASAGSPMQIFHSPVLPDGRGYKAEIRLPKQVPVEAIVAKKPVLAHNLVRTQREVWITEPSAAVLGLWIADPGVLSEPVPPWPLLAELKTAQTDYFKSVPVGVDMRGDVVNTRFFECNHAYGGAMGSGKSTLAITAILGAMLDPLVEIDVFVCAPNADYEAMRPRLRTLETGTGDDVPDAAVACMKELYDSIEYRGRALQNAGERSLTRAMAAKDPKLRPRIVVIDECQRVFADNDKVDKFNKKGPTRGEIATDIAVQLVNAARKYGITLILLTPEPTGNSLPRKLLSVFTHKACGSIGDQTSNDAVLGTGSYKAGISAVGLEPKTDDALNDCGTLMTKGFTPKPGLLRSYYVSVADATLVTQRAMRLREGIQPDAIEPAKARDFLADLDEVMGAEVKVRTDEVRHRLIELHRGTYGKWTPQDLIAALAKVGMQARKTGGLMHVRAVDVADALDARDDDAEADEDAAG